MSNQYLGGDASLACSFETQTKLDRMVVDLVTEQHNKAKQILQDNIGKLHELAKFLYEEETITGEQFMDILDGRYILTEKNRAMITDTQVSSDDGTGSSETQA